MDLYWVPNLPTGSCWRCHGLRWERQYIKGDADKYRSLFQLGDGETILRLAADKGSLRSLRVLQAAEEEGVLPRRLTAIPRWQRR